MTLDRLDSYDAARGTPRAWLFGIATNLVRRHWCTERRRLDALARLDDGRTGDDSGRVDERLDGSRTVERVLNRIANLALEDRDLLVLVAWEGLSHRDVADALGLPVGTVGSRLHRIREQLRRGVHDA